MKNIIFALPLIASIAFAPQAIAEDPLILSSVSPSSGSTEGGQTITISGSGFTSSTQIKIGGVDVSENLIDSSTITFISPSMSAGLVNVIALDGISGPSLNDAYEYIEPVSEPDPEPEPTPEPEPNPEPEPTPAPAPAPEPQTPSSPVSDPVVEEAVEEAVLEFIEITPDVTYLSDNAFILYENSTENLVVRTEYDVPQKFVLRQRVDGDWVYIDKSYQFDGNVAFLNTELQLGETYKVIVEINDKKTIAAWFTVLEKKYEVS